MEQAMLGTHLAPQLPQRAAPTHTPFWVEQRRSTAHGLHIAHYKTGAGGIGLFAVRLDNHSGPMPAASPMVMAIGAITSTSFMLGCRYR